MKALIVDDSRAIRIIIGKTLKSLGFDVVEAGSGREALDLIAAKGPFEVALFDWNMPEMSGLELVEAVRQNPEHAPMRIMMVTSESEHAQVFRALEAGATEYLMKPFSPEAIAEKLALMGLGAE